MKFVLLTILAYLIGSIPFAYIIAKAHGKNLRQIGSGNIGATNLTRLLGKRWGCTCFVLDVSKGFIPMLIGAFLVSGQSTIIELLLWLTVGISAVIGHIFPIYLKFKGGKGVATSFGVALGLWPYFTVSALIAFAIWMIFLLTFRYVSLASMVASVAVPVTLLCLILVLKNWKFENLWPLFIAAVAIPTIVIIRHKSNIKNIIDGTESKIFQK